MREYVDRKYDLSTKEKAKNEAKAAADRKAIEDAAIEKWKAEHPRSVESRPRASRRHQVRQVHQAARREAQLVADRSRTRSLNTWRVRKNIPSC